MEEEDFEDTPEEWVPPDIWDDYPLLPFFPFASFGGKLYLRMLERSIPMDEVCCAEVGALLEGYDVEADGDLGVLRVFRLAEIAMVKN